MLAILLIGLCVVLRIVPHPPNFAPVGATAIFAGRTMTPRAMIVVLLASSLVGDAFLAAIHGYPFLTGVTPFVYGAFLLQGAIGRGLRDRRGGLLAAAPAGSLVFFVISNLGVWLTTGMYPRTLDGLAACYALALPFLGATVLSDLLWTAALSLAHRQLAGRFPALAAPDARTLPAV